MTNKVHSVYLLTGTDHEGIKKRIKEIENYIIKQGNKIDSFSFFAEDSHAQDIVSECNTYSILSAVKIVKVFNSDLLDHKIITKYIESPCSSAVLILTSSKAKKDINKNIVKYSEEFGLCQVFMEKKSNELMELLSTKLDKAKIKYEINAISHLIEQEEGYLTNIDYIVNTIKNFYTNGKTFKASDIPHILCASRIPSVFEFIECLFSNDILKSLRLFRLIINEDDKCIFLISMIHRQLRLLWRLKTLKKSNTHAKEINKVIGLPQFVVNKLYAQEKRFSFSHLESLFHFLTNLDYSVRVLDKISYMVKFEIFITKFKT